MTRAVIKRFFLTNALLVIFGLSVMAQIKNIGIPFIRNFPKREYKAGTQNWSIAQDRRGFMYFANNEGLLIFDGVNWQLFKMPNGSITRSVFISDQGKIYVSAYNEIGELDYSANGKLEFKSLKRFIPDADQSFDDVWNITSLDSKVIFQSYSKAFILTNDSIIKVVKAPSRFQNAFKVRDRLFFNDIENGLLEMAQGELHTMQGCQDLKGEDIVSILPFGTGDEFMVLTVKQGAFLFNGRQLSPWKTPANEYLTKNRLFCATAIRDRYYAVGTIQDGVTIFDGRGEILQHINREQGLQNNTVLRVFNDRSGDLWLGLDNGIDYININSPITFIKQSEGIGAGYTSLIFNNRLYLGTNQGLFVGTWSENGQTGPFKMISNTEGQVWYLGVHDGQLICGHNNGTYLVEGDKAQQICKVPGGWKYHVLNRFPGYMVGGTYNGLILFQKVGNTWKFLKKIKGFEESFRIFEEDQEGNLWMSHGFKGVYRVSFNSTLDSVASFRYFTTRDGLPTNYNLSVYKVKGQIVVTSNKGIFQYNPVKDQFERSLFFNQLFSPLIDFSYLKEDLRGNIWYIAWFNASNRAGIFRIQEDGSYQQITAPFIQLNGKFISGFESIYPYSEQHLFLGLEEGFAHYSPVASYKLNPDFSTYITRAIATNQDSTFYYGEPLSSNKKANRRYTFNFQGNAFKIFYAAPVYNHQSSVEYCYKLNGLNNEWSPWSSSSYVEFALLPEGNYSFIVKARNSLGVESEQDELLFTITPPWYRSMFAFLIYAILLILIALLVVWIIVKRIEISKRKERLSHLRDYRQKEQDYIRQAALAEKKIITLKNETLRNEMIHRDKELANQTMDLIHKNKFLAKVKEELEKIKGSTGDEQLKGKISSLITRIAKDVDHNKQWEVFETAFDEVHEDFLNRLKVRFPSLTPKELRLCAYLRLNISSKEIAPLMNISIRGVEICRYRVRKKLQIDRDTNLTSLIMDL